MTHETEPLTDRDAVEQVSALVVERLKRGTARDEIAVELVELGLEREKADELIDSVARESAAAADRERVDRGALLRAGAAGLAAALVCGLVWAWLAVATEREFGIVAWALGLACGLAVALAARRSRGPKLQALAVAMSVVGILWGKYLAVYGFIQQAGGGEAPGLFSGGMMQLFAQHLGATWGPLDFLWLALAVVSAWQIPRGSGLPGRSG